MNKRPLHLDLRGRTPEGAHMKAKSTYATITLRDGRQAAIMRRHADGLELMPLGGALFRPGERIELSGNVAGREAVATLVVGGRCGPGNRCVRIRAVSVA